MKQGLIDVWPLLIPVVPFGLVYGVLVTDSATSTFWGWFASPIVMGGASQLTLIALLDEGVAMASALASALVINARHLMYSAAMAPHFAEQPRWFRLVGSLFVIDQVFALAMLRLDDPPAYRRSYWLATGISFWSMWFLMTTIGVVFGGAVPESWHVEFSVSILFLSLVVNGLSTSPGVVAAATGFGVAVVAGPIPNRLGLLVGAVAGVAAGSWAEVRKP